MWHSDWLYCPLLRCTGTSIKCNKRKLAEINALNTSVKKVNYVCRARNLVFSIVFWFLDLDCFVLSTLGLLSEQSGLVGLARRRPPVTRHVSSKWPWAIFFYDQVVAGSRLQNLERAPVWHRIGSPKHAYWKIFVFSYCLIYRKWHKYFLNRFNNFILFQQGSRLPGQIVQEFLPPWIPGYLSSLQIRLMQPRKLLKCHI